MRPVFREKLLLEWVAAGSLLLLALAVGYRPLTDPDLGWHVAGGLWMFEQGTVPRVDPFASGGSYWLDYSWLAELLFAFVYRLGGFAALQLLQVIAVVLFALISFYSLLVLAQDKKDVLQSVVAASLGCFVAVLFTAPIWHLRPQLFSVLFFQLAVVLAERARLKLRWLLPLIVLWANIHVFWVFLPLIVILYQPISGSLLSWVKRTAVTVLLLTSAALINPYGAQNFYGLFTYSFFHQTANGLIKEFQHLSPAFGYLFWLLLFVVAGVFVYGKLVWRERRPLMLLFACFSLLALWQIKFLPLFGIVAGVVVCRLSFVRLQFKPLARSSRRSRIISAFAVFAFLALWGSLLEYQPTLNERERNLLAASAQISALGGGSNNEYLVVLNDFDDGGWLELGLYLSRPSGLTESPFRVSIDGRTLVMGEQRLAAFSKLVSLQKGWCATVESWNVSFAVLEREAALAKELLSSGACGSWAVEASFGSFVVLRKL